MLVLIASLAHAQAADAPLAERPAMVVEAGSIVPFAGVCMTDGKAVETAKRLASAEAQVAALDGKSIMPTAAVVALIGVAGAAVVTSIALGVALAQKKPAP